MPFTGHTLPRMPDTVRKSPPHLRTLAERRARAAGEVCRLQKVVETAAKQLSAAETTLSEFDALLQRIERRLNPSDIAPIRAHAAYQGLPRGALGKTILEILKTAGEVTTSGIADEIQARFQIEFLIEEARNHWRHNSVGKQLRLYLKSGLIERIRVPMINGEVVRWRLKSDAAPSSDHLREQAAARGAEVLEYDAYHE
jgi:predicted DNA binding CopG/RHH family protein